MADPIDPDFYKTRDEEDELHFEHKVWGPVDEPTLAGIHGMAVAVDFDICIADGACLPVCPTDVFEWFTVPGHPASEEKADPERESDCIFCMACEAVCPVEAIKITENVHPFSE